MDEFINLISAEDWANLPVVLQQLNTAIDDILIPLLQQFRDVGRTSPTFQLWDDFLQKVTLPLKQFISATRNGKWDVYLSSKIAFLPLLFATNRTNYARYLPVITLLMQRLPEEVIQSFEEGLFVAKIFAGMFNGVWLDYTLESTENKALKGQGGIIGLTLCDSALSRWFLSRPITGKYSMAFASEFLNVLSTKKQHNHTSKATMKRWDDDVMKMKAMFDGLYTDPFRIQEAPEKFINFATGVVATDDVQRSMRKEWKWPRNLYKKDV